MNHDLLNNVESPLAGNVSRWTAVCLGLALLPFLIAADDADASRREESRRRIGDMTAPERRRLDENYKAFQELPADQQSQLRELRQAIDRDPELKASFEAYQTLANSLSPWQRNEVRKQTDPKARLRMIEEFRREPDPLFFPPSQTGGREAFNRPGRRQIFEKIVGRSSRMLGIVPASLHETRAMIDILERHLPAARQEDLAKQDAFTRMVSVVQDTRLRNRNLPPQFKLLGNPKDPNNDTFTSLLAVLDEGGPAKDFVLNKRFPPDFQQSVLSMVLMRGLTNALLLTIDEHFPRDETLNRFFESLSPAVKQSLAAMPEQERREKLQQRYLEEQIPGIPEWRVMWLEIQQSSPGDFLRRPPGGEGDRGFRPNGQPPFGPLDGSRRPDRRPEDDRPPNRPGDEHLKNRNEGERPKVLLEEDRPKERRPVGRE